MQEEQLTARTDTSRLTDKKVNHTPPDHSSRRKRGCSSDFVPSPRIMVYNKQRLAHDPSGTTTYS